MVSKAQRTEEFSYMVAGLWWCAPARGQLKCRILSQTEQYSKVLSPGSWPLGQDCVMHPRLTWAYNDLCLGIRSLTANTTIATIT